VTHRPFLSLHRFPNLCHLQFIIAFEEPLSPGILAAFDAEISSLRGSSISYLPDNAILALLPPAAVASVEALAGERISFLSRAQFSTEASIMCRPQVLCIK